MSILSNLMLGKFVFEQNILWVQRDGGGGGGGVGGMGHYVFEKIKFLHSMNFGWYLNYNSRRV